jgi:hypothetical protein
MCSSLHWDKVFAMPLRCLDCSLVRHQDAAITTHSSRNKHDMMQIGAYTQTFVSAMLSARKYAMPS